MNGYGLGFKFCTFYAFVGILQAPIPKLQFPGVYN